MGKHTLWFMDRKDEKSNHLAEINLVPNLCQWTFIIIIIIITIKEMKLVWEVFTIRGVRILFVYSKHTFT
jgi:hypothetical protein